MTSNPLKNFDRQIAWQRYGLRQCSFGCWLNARQPFKPEGILKGIPYRLTVDGTIDAMMTGGLVHFRDMEQFRAAAEGRDEVQTKIIPASTTYRGYTYFAQKDGIDVKIDRGIRHLDVKIDRGIRHFQNEKEAMAYIDAISNSAPYGLF